MPPERALIRRADRTNMDVLLSKPDVRRQIMNALPKHMDVDRLCRQAITLLSTNPTLTECSEVSVLAGIIRAGELGLELSGPLGHAYLVPRRSKQTSCQEACFQLGYKGIINLAFRSDCLSAWHMRTVKEHDSFDYQYGTHPKIEHKPARQQRGKPTHFYSIAFFRAGGSDFEVMTVEEAQDHRKRYAPRNPMWDTSFEAMAQKTTAHKLGKRCPLSIEFQGAISEDEVNGIEALDEAKMPDGAGQRATRTEALLEHFGGGDAPLVDDGINEPPLDGRDE